MASVYTFTPRSTVRKRENVSLNVFGVATWAVIAFLALLFLMGGLLLLGEYHHLQTVSARVHDLERETAELQKRYELLTSKEVVLKKVKPLGLHEAKKEEIVWVE